MPKKASKPRAKPGFADSEKLTKEIGRVVAEKAYEHLAGKPVEKDIKIPVKLVTRENADDFEKGK